MKYFIIGFAVTLSSLIAADIILRKTITYARAFGGSEMIGHNYIFF